MPQNPTPAQSAASRRNGAKSEGPKDTSRTRFNAVKHGLLAKALFFASEEERRQFEELHEALVADLQPEGRMELILVEQIASCYLRLAHVVLLINVQSLAPGDRREVLVADDVELARERYCTVYRPEFDETLLRYERDLDRQLHRALTALRQLQAFRLARSRVQSSLPALSAAAPSTDRGGLPQPQLPPRRNEREPRLPSPRRGGDPPRRRLPAASAAAIPAPAATAPAPNEPEQRPARRSVGRPDTPVHPERSRRVGPVLMTRKAARPALTGVTGAVVGVLGTRFLQKAGSPEVAS